MGLVCGFALALAAKFLAVKEDPRVEQATEILPGANCGGCGYAGCGEFARAMVEDGADITLCAPGGAETLTNLAAFFGVAAEATEPKVALVLCNGTRDKAAQKYQYNGIADCAAAHAIGGGDKQCAYGCLGYGSCSRACPTGAIELTDGIAVVHPDLCIGCSACVRTCPRELIQMVPESSTIHVLCSSHDKGPAVKKACSVGCIGCTACTKVADNESISMDRFLAVVDYEKTLTSEAVIDKCPMSTIVKRSMKAAPVGADAAKQPSPHEEQKDA